MHERNHYDRVLSYHERMREYLIAAPAVHQISPQPPPLPVRHCKEKMIKGLQRRDGHGIVQPLLNVLSGNYWSGLPHPRLFSRIRDVRGDAPFQAFLKPASAMAQAWAAQHHHDEDAAQSFWLQVQACGFVPLPLLGLAAPHCRSLSSYSVALMGLPMMDGDFVATGSLHFSKLLAAALPFPTSLFFLLAHSPALLELLPPLLS